MKNDVKRIDVLLSPHSVVAQFTRFMHNADMLTRRRTAPATATAVREGARTSQAVGAEERRPSSQEIISCFRL